MTMGMSTELMAPAVATINSMLGAFIEYRAP